MLGGQRVRTTWYWHLDQYDLAGPGVRILNARALAHPDGRCGSPDLRRLAPLEIVSGVICGYAEAILVSPQVRGGGVWPRPHHRGAGLAGETQEALPEAREEGSLLDED